jgi:hypothetical protein
MKKKYRVKSRIKICTGIMTISKGCAGRSGERE